MEIAYTLTTWILPLLLVVILHEVAHGYIALKLGDRTALTMGRLTLDPRKHIDPVGSILIPGILLLSGSKFLFGWAKPVPIDTRRFAHPKRDMGIVAASGPLMNVALAVVFAAVLKLVMLLPAGSVVLWAGQNLVNGVQLSLILAVFNLFPILPLDGGRVLLSLLPPKYAYHYAQSEKYGFLILFGVLFILPMAGLDIFGWFAGVLYPLFLSIVGLVM
ncbi:MAG: site-2 protease family protein [Alphaproteobacteria bacterium]|nr:site-2 protease family protein [Alphaproteobacteria bacterium]